jgi:glycosyltransferase involved in cell wall biosynthesis
VNFPSKINFAVTKKPYSITVLIPVYNEEESIHIVLEQITDIVFPFPVDLEIVTVNDGSSDRTALEIERFASNFNGTIQMINILDNKGKGHAIRQGIEFASKSHLVIQDADLELHPKNLIQLVSKSNDFPSSAIYGSRFSDRRKVQGVSDSANVVLTKIFNLLSGCKLTDMETCYKLARTEYWKELKLRENRFGIEPEISMKLSKMKVPILEVPVTFNRRTKEEGKKLGWKDGFRAIYCLVKYRIRSF